MEPSDLRLRAARTLDLRGLRALHATHEGEVLLLTEYLAAAELAQDLELGGDARRLCELRDRTGRLRARLGELGVPSPVLAEAARPRAIALHDLCALARAAAGQFGGGLELTLAAAAAALACSDVRRLCRHGDVLGQLASAGAPQPSRPLVLDLLAAERMYACARHAQVVRALAPPERPALTALRLRFAAVVVPLELSAALRHSLAGAWLRADAAVEAFEKKLALA